MRTKTTPTDPVTVVDTETERLLRDRLAELRPGDPMLGEEGGGPADRGRPRRADTVTWVLDPIDGTVNFVYGIPAYAVSVGAQVDGVSVAGAVANVVGRPGVFGGDRPRRPCHDEQGTHALRCNGIDRSVDGAGGHRLRLRARRGLSRRRSWPDAAGGA